MMKMKSIALLVVTLQLLCLPLDAQSSASDWNNVRQLIPGTGISIRTNVRIRCEFSDATDNSITCRVNGFGAAAGLRVFDRNRIQEVRLSHPKTKAALGAVLGAGAGIAGGAAAPPDKNGSRLTLMVALGAAGAGVGAAFGYFFGYGKGPLVYGR
jgi:hypothetical protein